MDEYFKGYVTAYFFEGIKKMEERWTKCIEVEGDYVKKLKKEFRIKKAFLYILPSLLKENDPRKFKFLMLSLIGHFLAGV